MERGLRELAHDVASHSMRRLIESVAADLEGVRDVGDVRDALRTLPTPDPERRQEFLRDHFRPGHAGNRIAVTIANTVGLHSG